MNLRDFTTTFCVHQTSEEAFYAINNPRGWWSKILKAVLTNSVTSGRIATKTFTAAS